jgi:hypothetical protein
MRTVFPDARACSGQIAGRKDVAMIFALGVALKKRFFGCAGTRKAE